MNKKETSNPKNSESSREEYESALSRRNFVSAAAKLALIGALLDLPAGAAWAGDQRQVEAFMDKAVSMGDMSAALTKHADAHKLTPEQIKALSQIDKRELQVVGSLERLGLSDADFGKLAQATRRSTDPDQLVASAGKMGFTREQMAGLKRLSPGEIEAFNSLATKLERSGKLESYVADW